MELTFVKEAIPKITRVGGSGREKEPWEEHLAVLKDDEHKNDEYRVWTYAKRSGAVSRMSTVRARLSSAVPQENWKLAVRQVPDSNPAEYGVYVSYEGVFTPDQMVENAKKHEERSQRVQKARAAKAAPQSASDGGQAEAAQPTAKERIAKADQARKSA